LLTRFEHFAVTEMIGAPDRPPRANGRLCFSEDWERTAFGVALALAKSGRFEWEDFRQNLIEVIRGWETSHDLADPSWNYYERWMDALERVAIQSGLVTEGEIDSRVQGLSGAGMSPDHQRSRDPVAT
jgi:nitrile hydratase accessory protein